MEKAKDFGLAAIRQNDNEMLVKLQGYMTMKAVEPLKKLGDTESATKFIFDLTRVEYIDSTGIAALLLFKRKVSGAEIVLRSATEDVKKILNIANIGKLITLEQAA